MTSTLEFIPEGVATLRAIEVAARERGYYVDKGAAYGSRHVGGRLRNAPGYRVMRMAEAGTDGRWKRSANRLADVVDIINHDLRIRRGAAAFRHTEA